MLQSNIYTTQHLLNESWEHFQWAKSHVRRFGTSSPELLAVATNRPGNKQNLFIDGFIRSSADGIVQTFEDYERLIFPYGTEKDQFKHDMLRRGIATINLRDLEGFADIDDEETAALQAPIRKERAMRGTFRTELQVAAEAEVFQIVQALRTQRYAIRALERPYERIYFVSLSRVLDRVSSPDQPVITWTPEAVYRYVMALPGEATSPELLQECMLSEYYYAGITVVDKQRYLRFFGPVVNAARVEFEDQKQKFVQELEPSQVEKLEEAFENTPDLEKPFFVTQLVWRAAEAAERKAAQAAKRAATAEEKVKQLEREKETNFKVRDNRRKQEQDGRAKHQGDPNRQRKIRNQAKKKMKKKKK